MRRVVIEEAKNGYILRLTKYFGNSVIKDDTTVHNELAKVKEEITDYFQED